MFTLHTHNLERESESCLPQKCVLSSNRLCAGQFPLPLRILSGTERHRKKALIQLLKIEKPERPEANQAMAPSK